MTTRLLAVLAAVAMVVGAVVARGRIDDRGGPTGTPLRLVCVTELAAVCDAVASQAKVKVDATVEPAATTADKLTRVGPGQAPPLDGWLTMAPWPAIVAEARARAGTDPLVKAGGVLARSPVVLAVQTDREPVLKARCQGDPGWKCLGEVAGMPWGALPGGNATWGTVKPGHPDVTSAAGLTVMGAATAAFFTDRHDLSSTDLDDEGYQTWLDRLEASVPERPASPLLTMLQRPSAFDAVGALEAEAGPTLATAAGSKPILLYPSPVTTADVVLATTGGRAIEMAALAGGDAVRHALAANGWRVDAVAPVAGIKAGVVLPATSHLPSPGFLDALRARVAQAG